MRWKSVRGLFNSLRRPCVSVIVPFYNSRETVEKCIYSVLESGLSIPLEIVCVDDGSSDGGGQLVRRIKRKHWNVRLIRHPKNRGLFQARLTGIGAARGSYIGFVDSDDYVTDRYFADLYRVIKASGADIAVGRIVNVSREGVRYWQTRCLDFPYTCDAEKLGQEGVYAEYWNQAGRCYPWYVVWNKLYAGTLLKSVVKENEALIADLRITMLEDFVYSSLVMGRVESFCTSGKACYFYTESDSASTSKSLSSDRWEKNIEDMGQAFQIVGTFLESVFREENPYAEKLKEWKGRYVRYWFRNIAESGFDFNERTALCGRLLDALETDCVLTMPDEEDDYYYAEADTPHF